MADGRVAFLASFIRMFDGTSLRVDRATCDAVEGVVTYEGEGTEQPIRWHCAEQRTPSPDCKALADFIARGFRLDIDRIPIPRSSLLHSFLQASGTSWEHARFEDAFNELLAIRVAMVDEGKENDAFFVHE